MSTQASGYGYEDDNGAVSSGPVGKFGLNPAAGKLLKWEYITNGGAGGAPGEALDIVLSINGQEKSMRKFPITKAFLPNNGGETTDPTNQAFKDAVKEQNAVLTHILTKFISREQLIQALSIPGMSFKQYCEITHALLGTANPPSVTLDVFMQYQWQFSGTNTRTFLEIPGKMKQGIWLAVAKAPLAADGVSPGTWEERRVENPTNEEPKALYYVDQAGNEHEFTRNGWFMNSNFANQQIEAGSGNAANMAPPATNLPPATPPTQQPPLPAATAPGAVPAGTPPPPPTTGGW